MIYLKSETLKKQIAGLFKDSGVCSDSIKHVVDSMIQTSLRGVDSHGVNLFPHYFRAIKSGRINSNPNIKIIQSAKSTILVDADHAFGHHSGAVAMDHAIEIALQNGVAAVNVKNSTHFGAAAYFGLRAAQKDCIGFAFTNADALVKAFGAKDKFFGTNPICFTAPMEKEDPFCLDMATSIVSWNKIKNCVAEGVTIPESWAFDADGNPVNNPKDATSVRPIGDYKGFGLGAMIDILCAFLSTNPTSKEMLPMFTSPIEAQRQVSHFFIALNINSFVNIDNFKNRLQSMVDQIRKLEPDQQSNNVLVAGDPEKKTSRERIISGIPITNEKFKEFLDISTSFQESIIS